MKRDNESHGRLEAIWIKRAHGGVMDPNDRVDDGEIAIGDEVMWVDSEE